MTYSIYTDIGGRAVNEDSVKVYESDEKNCFVLCDGLGGHGMGDKASSLVTEVFGEVFSKLDDMVNFIGEAFRYAQNRLMSEQKVLNAASKMKTTGVAVVNDADTLYIGHIGDSRCYVFGRNKVKARTLDHSVPQMLVLAGEIKEKEIRNHPDRNSLLRVMGIEWDEPMYELAEPMPLQKCQAVLLCSDGFWELIEEKEMCRLLKKSKTVEDWLESMAAVVKENGKNRDMDNNSAIAIWF